MSKTVAAVSMTTSLVALAALARGLLSLPEAEAKAPVGVVWLTPEKEAAPPTA